MKLSTKELQELKYVQEWEYDYINKKQNQLTGRTGRFLSNTLSNSSKIAMPERARMMKTIISESIETAVIGCMDAGQYAVKYTYDKEKAVKKFKGNGVNALDDLYKIEVIELDKLARDVALENKLIGLVEGFAFGLGDIIAATAEIPFFITLNFRVMQQICAIYGYDPEDPKEKMYMIKLMSFGTAFQGSGKLAALAELQTLKIGIKKYTFKELQKMGGKYSVIITARTIGKNVGVRLTRNKLLQGIPILGGVFGGFFNYGFIYKMAEITNAMYKKRFLEDKLDKNDNDEERIIDLSIEGKAF